MDGANRDTLSVSELNLYIKNVLEGNPALRDVWVAGEISGARLYASGHLYFSLKDADSVISAVMFRGAVARLRFQPENGMRVIIHGKVSVYEPRGQYQLIAEGMAPDGAGALAIAFEQLKNRLAAEGLFDPARKKPLPPHPRRIGVITSASGAAIHDIIRVAGSRCPSAEILLFPSQVQGADAPRYLAGGVRYFNSKRGDPEQGVDVIIMGRGGGSAEDLWCFNDEQLARTIAASEIPIISAVGHEVDFSISDFVADCRAATPSAAAEIAVPDQTELRKNIGQLSARLDGAISSRLKSRRILLDRLSAAKVLSAPEGVYVRRGERLGVLADRLDRSMDRRLTAADQSRRRLAGQLEALNPLSVLTRGYALVLKEDGHVAASAEALYPEETVTLRFSDGAVTAVVTGKCEETHAPAEDAL